MAKQRHILGSSEKKDNYKDIIGFLFSLEENVEKELDNLGNKLKETLEKLIEKKLDYYY